MDPVDNPSKLYRRAVKDAKITKMMKRTTDVVAAVVGLLRKSCSEIVNAAHMTKALAASQLIFKSKRFVFPGQISVMG
jgi:lipopolysaccharide/colanic/teichoic acid biosynthesis glycosyltransferase